MWQLKCCYRVTIFLKVHLRAVLRGLFLKSSLILIGKNIQRRADYIAICTQKCHVFLKIQQNIGPQLWKPATIHMIWGFQMEYNFFGPAWKITGIWSPCCYIGIIWCSDLQSRSGLVGFLSEYFGWGSKSDVWGLMVQWGSTKKRSIVLPFAFRHWIWLRDCS